jgi:glutamate synthase domain-containing protein 3
VLDDERLLGARCSRAMVDLEALTKEGEDIVRALVEEHVAHTRSARGTNVLATWSKRHFVKVMPHEWRRVLQLRAAEDEAKAAHG